MKEADIIIIGGGAAGLMAACGAGDQFAKDNQVSHKIVVLEKMPRPARKMMITGKGRCNLTNLREWNEFQEHVHPKANFLKSAFYNMSSQGMMDFLENHGLELVVERGERVFPMSHLASDVIDTMVRVAQEAGADILCNKTVKEITKEPEEDNFIIRCNDGSEFKGPKVIICTGGLSYPRTGSTGDGYAWADHFGVRMTPRFPSLTAIVPKSYKQDETKGEIKGHIPRERAMSEIGQALCGIQLKNVGLQLIVDGDIVADEFGDLDFTDGGLEGPIGFKISRKCVNSIINGARVAVRIDLKPAVELERLQQRIRSSWDDLCKDKRLSAQSYSQRFRVLLSQVMPSSLIPAFVKFFPNLDHKTLAKALKCWPLDIAGFVGYERCVITAGGVAQNEVVSKSMECKKISGLYFAGEILDLDADTGGYNLQTAFSTGYLAGQHAAKSL